MTFTSIYINCLPKLAALCNVISRMTRVPKADHSNKNCLAKRRPPPFRRLELWNIKIRT